MKKAKKLQLNDAQHTEIIEVNLTPEDTPIAFNAMVDELMRNGLEREDAELSVLRNPVQLEIMYHPDYGLFGVDTEAIESGADIYSPYTAELYEQPDE